MDTKVSVKFGDRFVINKVPTNITGNKTISCGVFIFDPNKKLTNFCPWRYKGVWAGKPFDEKNNFQMVKEYNNPFNNPLIQDLLSNTNALGEDSITRKLMSLMFAFLKKQILVESTDLETSIETLMENIIYDALQKITVDLAKYEHLTEQFKNFNNKTEEEKNNLEKEFYDYFGELINYGFTKQSKKETIIKKYWKSTKKSSYKEYGKSLGDEKSRESKSGDERGRS